MESTFVLGLRTRIVVSLAVVMALFIVVTEMSVSQLVRVTVMKQAAQSSHIEAGDGTEPSFDPSKELTSLRKLVLFYMVFGAIVAILLSYLAVSRSVVAPLGKVTGAVEKVAAGNLDIEVPISGSKEMVQLGVSFNRMTGRLKSQQTELRAQLDELEKYSEDLRSAQDRLIRAARLASVGTLAAGIAHEIGNPIAGVLGLLDALDTSDNVDQSARYRELIRKEVGRIDRIIGELLTYARPKIQGTSISGQSDPARVLEHVQSLLRAQKLFDKIDLVVDVEEGLSAAMPADEMTQLLVNLLLNAAQAMDGKGRVAVLVEKVPVWRPALSAVSREAVRIIVTDNGPGIPPDIADKIFDPFFTRRGTGGGTGLGLAICQSICDRFGAEIEVDGSHVDGARFIVTTAAVSE